MSFESPEFKNNIWENKKSEDFREWITEQALSLPDSWSDEFRSYVDLRYKESKEKDEKNQESEQKTIERYLSGLDLEIDSLRSKKILDMGCETGDFIRYCLDNNITKDAYGTDACLKEKALDEKYTNNFFETDFKNDFPVKNLDYIFSVGAVSLYTNKEYLADLEVIFNKAIDALSEGGEFRIYPIPKVSEKSDLEGIKESQIVISNILGKLQKERDIKYEMRSIDICVSGSGKDVWIEQALIIKPGLVE